MKGKMRLSAITLVMLTALLSFAALFARNAICKLVAPEVNVIPPEAGIGQQVIVKAKINVIAC